MIPPHLTDAKKGAFSLFCATPTTASDPVVFHIGRCNLRSGFCTAFCEATGRIDFRTMPMANLEDLLDKITNDMGKSVKHVYCGRCLRIAFE